MILVFVLDVLGDVGPRHGDHAQAPPSRGVGRTWEDVGAAEDDTNVAAFGVELGVAIVFYEAGLGGVDGVVTTHADVFAWVPLGAALTEDDVAGYYVFLCDIHLVRMIDSSL